MLSLECPAERTKELVQNWFEGKPPETKMEKKARLKEAYEKKKALKEERDRLSKERARLNKKSARSKPTETESESKKKPENQFQLGTGMNRLFEPRTSADSTKSTSAEFEPNDDFVSLRSIAKDDPVSKAMANSGWVSRYLKVG
jgi:hypothetical protein